MKSQILQLAANILILSAMSASAAIRYVNVSSVSPAPPYTTWTTAAKTIQDAVDAAVAGDQILVTNGVYSAGGRVMYDGMGADGATNRVVVNKPMTVRSVNGAAVTLIQGDHVMRCVYLANGAVLEGFTLANGWAGGGGGGVWCESTNAIVSNCVLTGNSAFQGGGAYSGTLNDCAIDGNSAFEGGGTKNSLLNNCILLDNSADYGGGASAGFGNSGGGVASGFALNNCTINRNSARVIGGGTYDCILNNCTVTENSAGDQGGGAAGSTLNNCIIYYNSAPTEANYSDIIHSLGPSELKLNYCVTTPLPENGTGNLTNSPLFVDLIGGNLRLQSNSPCINAGSNASAPSGPDLAGNPRITGGTVDIGAYEFQSPPSPISSIHYVNMNSTSPTLPYTNWTTAAKTIQDAVDAALAGDQILVTNGVYQTGGCLVAGEMTRVAVKKAVTVQSVNGAAVTLIQGSHIMRCLYLTNGAALLGFTLSNGFAENNGGGLLCDPDAVVSNCVLSGNRAYKGGGTSAGTLNNCTLQGNAAYEGAGANGGTLNNCWITGNSATASGGGAAYSALNNCSLGSNSADSGGGVFAATLNNCTITGNSANDNGGGAFDCTLNGCTITGNSAANSGGGAYGSGPDESTLSNCIVYYNSAHYGYNYANSILRYCCTTPLPSQGVGNISFEPQLTDLSHLGASSPCRGSGNATYSIGLDIDGENWSKPPSIGCDEYYARVVDGPLGLSLQATYTNVAVGFAVNFTAVIYGHATSNRWEFADGTMTSNRPYASHSWSAAGAYSVVLQAYNDAYPAGISETITVHVVAQPAHYVAPSSVNPVAPYTSWATAAHNIQDAVDAASLAGALVLVTNGVYQTGGRTVFEADAITNRVSVTKAIVLRSVNGAAVTVIQGYYDPDSSDSDRAVRCIYLANGAALAGFTLTNGFGGVWCQSAGEAVSNCVLAGNSAVYGGGAYGGTLNDCTLTANSAYGYGGGAVNSTLNNCTLAANSGFSGGGVVHCTLNNCLLTENSANFGGGGALSSILNNCTLSRNGGGGAFGGTLINCIVYYNSPENYTDDCLLSYSCTTPLPTGGTGNLTNAPLFMDYAGGNLRLQSNSPCINAGSNNSAPVGPDLDGYPRIVGGTVDIGAYEFPSPQSFISYAWLQQYGLPTDGSADVTDLDGDGLNNWQEWRAGTNPTNALSVLRLLNAAPGATGLAVSWRSMTGVNYFLERSTNLEAQPPFVPLAANIIGQPGTTIFPDTNAVGIGPFFYRVGVQD